MTPRRAIAAAVVLLAGIVAPAGGPAPGDAGVEDRFREADRRLRSGSFLRAQRILEDLELHARDAADPRARVRALRELGRTLDVRAEHDESPALWDRALDAARSIGDGGLEGSILLEEGLAAWRRADYASAEELARAALRLAEAAGEAAGRAKGAMLLGRIELKRGRYREAIGLEEEALALAKHAGDLQGEADALQALGEIHLDLRAFATAERALRRRLALVRELGDADQEAHALNYLGFVHQQGGDLDTALALQEEALRVARASGDEGSLSHALHSLGSVHRDLARHDDARADYVEAIRLREAAGDPRSRAWSLAGLGRIEKERSRPKAALEAYRGAVEVFERIRDRRALAWHLYEVAGLHAALGERKEARAAFRRTLAEMEAIALPYACLALADYGLLLAEEGEAERAAELGRAARAGAEATGSPEMEWTAAHRNGRILLRLGRREEALASMLDGIAIIEGMRPELLPSDGAKSGFFAKRQSVYEDAASLLVDLGRPERALEIAERARSRAFLDLLASGEAAPPVSDHLPREEDESVESPSEPLAHPALPGADRGGAFLPVAPRATPPLPSVATVEPPGLEAIREEARHRAAPILSYFTTSDRLLAWLVTPEGEVHSISEPVARGTLMKEAEAARGERGGERSRKSLHRLLIEPFERFLPSDPGRAVLVVPHGPLFLVSLGGLADARGRFVAERHALAYSPSIGVLRFLRTRAERPLHASRGVLVVGNPRMPPRRRGDPPLPPLPGADDEAEAVRRAWPDGAVKVLRGAAAGESAVRRLAPEAGVVHLATHGVLRADDPMRSYLALSADADGDPAGDGFLTAREVFDLRISADLVVLSACDTGLGRIDADGVMGLGRAFLNAGAGAVVATLWRVADRVAGREMELFHRELRRGAPKAEALRLSQAQTLRELRAGKLATAGGTPIGADPAFWAAFVVVGDPD